MSIFKNGICDLKTQKESPGLGSFTGEFYKMCKDELMPILHIIFRKIEEEGTLPNSFFTPD